MDNYNSNTNFDRSSDISTSIVSKNTFGDSIKSFFNGKKRTLVTASSFLIAMVMTGSVFYIAYKTYNQKNAVIKTGAANPSCYLELSLATPTPSPTPIACNKNLDIAIVIDRSSSMNSVEADGRTKLLWAKEAAAGFVQSLINSGSTSVRVSVSSFGRQGNDGTGTLAASNNSTLEVPLTNNLQGVLTAINNVKYINSGTCIECGLKISNAQLTSTTNRKVEILLSDGKANSIWNGTGTSAKSAAINAANTGRTNGIEYRTLGYGLKASGGIDEATLISIAGSASNYQYKPNVVDWSSAFLMILKDLCSTSPIGTSTASPTAVSTPVTTNIIASEDAYVASGSSVKAANYGTAPTLLVDGSPVYISYLKFDLSSLAGKVVNSATLRLKITNSSSGVQDMYTTLGTWTESGINYNNRPTLGTKITSFSGAKAGLDKDVDITSFVKANIGKVVTLVVNSTNTDGLDFNSKESSSGKPTIIVR